MSRDLVKYEQKDQVGILTMSDPARRNPLSRAMYAQLVDLVEGLSLDPSLSVLVLTGEGTAFTSGADMKDPGTHNESDFRNYHEGVGRGLFDVIEQSPLPVIAAINGPAIGAGANLAIACDLRVAGDSAFLQFAQVRRGVLAANGNMVRLARLVGTGAALDLGLTGRSCGAAEALQLRLVSRCVPDDEVMEAALDLASLIATQPPLAVRFTKEAVHHGWETGLKEAIHTDRLRMFLTYQTDERREAHQAWNEGRKPVYAQQEPS